MMSSTYIYVTHIFVVPAKVAPALLRLVKCEADTPVTTAV